MAASVAGNGLRRLFLPPPCRACTRFRNRNSDVRPASRHDHRRAADCRKKCLGLGYISGSIGTLIGADLLNLDKLQGMGAPVVSIGGAGTFDGIFLTGILAVVFASVSWRN